MYWLPPSRKHDAWPVLRLALLGFNGGCEVHKHRHRADNAARVVHQPHNLSKIGLTDEVDDAFERRVDMAVARFAALDELDAALIMVDDLLEAIRVGPLGGEVGFAARDDDPELSRQDSGDFLNLRHPGFFLVGQMDVALERMRLYVNAQSIVQKQTERMDKVVRKLIALVDQRVFATNGFGFRVAVAEFREVRVVVPKLTAGCSDLD
jgi:hypothetical protein